MKMLKSLRENGLCEFADGKINFINKLFYMQLI